MRNLLGRLHDRAPQELAAIARFWEIDLRGRDAHADAGQLYSALTDPWQFALAWERLSTTERAVVDTMADARAAMTAAEIASLTEQPDLEMYQAVDRLYQAGFLYSDDLAGDGERQGMPVDVPRFFLPREISHLSQRLETERARGSPAGESIEQLLDRLTDPELAEISEQMGRLVVPAVAIRADLLAAVVARLGDESYIRDAVRSLNPIATRLWRWLVEHSDETSTRPGTARRELGMSASELRQALAALARRGLIWRSYAADGSLVLVVPDLIRNPRKRPAPALPELVEARGPVIPNEWHYTHAAAWDLLTLLRGVSDGSVRVKDGQIEDSGPVSRRLGRSFWRGSADSAPTGYLDFLAYLAHALGLLKTGSSGVHVERMQAWTRQSFPEQTRRLFDLWRQTSDWPEGQAREALQVWGANWSGFRAHLLAALGELPLDTWVTLPSFAERVSAAGPNALGAHFSAAASREQPEESPESRRLAVIRLAVEITLTTAAHWLGLIEVSTAQREMVFRLLPLGVWLVRSGDEPRDEELGTRSLVVQPDFEIMLFRPSPRRVWALSSFSDADSLDRVSSFRLTRQSLERALRAGLTVPQITGFLEQQSETSLPQNVDFEVKSWAREYRRVRVRPSVLLEPDDRSAVDEIVRLVQEIGLRVERLTHERLLVVLGDDDQPDGLLQQIEEVLRAGGQMPLRGRGGRERTRPTRRSD